MKIIKLLAVLMLGLMFSACSTSDILESKVTEPQVYVLKPADAGTAQVAFKSQLAVALPTATPGLDTDRIAVLRNGNHLDYYYGVRWGDAAPAVVQAFVVSLLQSQQGFRNVVAEDARIDADYLLEITLSDFQAEYTSNNDAPLVRVTLAANLINVKERTTSPLLHATAAAQATDNRLGAVVNAFQTALQKATVSLSEQVTASIGK